MLFFFKKFRYMFTQKIWSNPSRELAGGKKTNQPTTVFTFSSTACSLLLAIAHQVYIYSVA